MATECQFAQKAVILHDGHILLVRKSPDDPYHPMSWELPGGRRVEGESLDEHIRREVREEVGLEVVPGRLLSLWDFVLHRDAGRPLVVAVTRECFPMNPHEVNLHAQSHTDFLDHWKWVPVADVGEFDLMESAREPILEALRQISCRPASD